MSKPKCQMNVKAQMTKVLTFGFWISFELNKQQENKYNWGYFMELTYQLALYIIAWVILIIGIFIGEKNPSIYLGDIACYIREVKIGLLILFASIIVSIIIFSFVAFEGFNLPNYFTVLACVFGIGTAFYFLYKIPPEIKDHSDMITAVKKGDTATVKALLIKGADVNAKTNNGWTALIFAAWKGHTATVKALLDNGADVNAKDKDGWAALIFAAFHGYTAIVRALVDKDADVNMKDKDGKTALMYATERGHTEIVEFLKKAGARE